MLSFSNKRNAIGMYVYPKIIGTQLGRSQKIPGTKSEVIVDPGHNFVYRQETVFHLVQSSRDVIVLANFVLYVYDVYCKFIILIIIIIIIIVTIIFIIIYSYLYTIHLTQGHGVEAVVTEPVHVATSRVTSYLKKKKHCRSIVDAKPVFVPDDTCTPPTFCILHTNSRLSYTRTHVSRIHTHTCGNKT